MVPVHHPHLFSRQWMQLHPGAVEKFKRYGILMGAGTLFAIAGFSMTNIEPGLSPSLKVVEVVDTASGKASVATAAADYYLPAQFVEQEKQANIEKLPPQF
jgi:hypothetical protein